MESSLPAHVEQAELLLDYVLSVLRMENERDHPHEFVPGSFRLGIAGPPGAGKSTFCEALGCLLTEQGHRVAVLAIDPSSTLSGGSLLGDKTRMLKLSYEPNAFVRPSPSNCSLGGVAEHTSDLVMLCEAAGYDTVIVETVGLGQSEVMIDDMVDMVMLLMPPAMGDELQGVKKGIMEHADIVVINKADGPLASFFFLLFSLYLVLLLVLKLKTVVLFNYSVSNINSGNVKLLVVPLFRKLVFKKSGIFVISSMKKL